MMRTTKSDKKSAAGCGVIKNAGGDPHAYLGHFRGPAVVKRGHNVGAPYDPRGKTPVGPGALPNAPAMGGGAAGTASNPTAPKAPTAAKSAPSTPAVESGGGFKTPASKPTVEAGGGFKTPTAGPKQVLAGAVGKVRGARQAMRKAMRKEKGGFKTPKATMQSMP